MNIILKMRKPFKTVLHFLFAFISFTVILTACKKNDLIEKNENDILKEQFFTLPAKVDPELIKIANQIKKQDQQFDFLSSFIKNNGLPSWDHVVSNSANTGQGSTTGQRNSKGSDSLIFFIPVQKLNAREISSYIVCLKTDTSYRLKLYQKNKLDKLVSSDAGRKSFLKGALSIFAYFEKKVNKKDSLFIAGIYNKHFSDVSITFGATSSINGKSFATEGFSAYSITVCYNISCGDYYGFRTDAHAGSCYNCNTSWFITWVSIPNDGSGDDWGGGGGGGGGSGGSGFSSNVTTLTNQLGLSYIQSYWLEQNPLRVSELLNYLQTTNNQQANIISLEHLDNMMSDLNYLAFVQQHSITGNANQVWWEDDNWLDNPQNFNLDPYDDYRKLTAAEKALVKQYPTAAFIINQFNRPMAKNYTIQKFGSNGLNDKSDAFRHAFFQAINTVRVGATLTQQFADAHETEGPSQLDMEKQMDLFNNSKGITYGQTQSYPASTPDMIADAIYTKVLNGELRYIKPLDFSASPYFDANHDGIQDCPTCLNGILSNSVLTPTNL